MLAWAYDELGGSDRARRLKEDVLQRARAPGDKHVQVHALEALAHVAAPERRVEEATALLSEAYELNRGLGDRFREAVLVCRFARALAFAGRVEAAGPSARRGRDALRGGGGQPDGVAQEGTTRR